MTQSIKHISFDLWMTLIRTHPEYKRKRAELFCHFFSVDNLELVEKAIRKTDLMANHINETTGGNIDALELYMMVLQEVHPDWKSFGIDALQSFYAKTEKLFSNYLPLAVDDSVTGALQMVSDSGITMNILSNTGFIKGNMLRKAIEQLGWASYFTFTIFSDETGHSKPSTKMFQEVWTCVSMQNHTIEKNEVLHFGDNPFADVEGASKFGFSAALFSPKQSTFCQQIEMVIKI
jgi:putative hydrolase of the HAD superfamily